MWYARWAVIIYLKNTDEERNAKPIAQLGLVVDDSKTGPFHYRTNEAFMPRPLAKHCPSALVSYGFLSPQIRTARS